MNKISAGIFVAVFLCVANVHSSCMDCTQAFGVSVGLQSGQTEQGYITWNTEISSVDAWIETINSAITGKASFPEPIAQKHCLQLYKTLQEVQFPNKITVAIKEDILEIPVPDLKTVKRVNLSQDGTDTTGLNALPKADVDILKKPPAHVISNETELGSSIYYVVASSETSPITVVRHLFRKYSEKLLLDGEVVAVDRYDFGGFNISCVGKLAKYAKNCAKFKADWEKYQEAHSQVVVCEREQDMLMNTLRKTTDYHSAFVNPGVREKDRECNALHTRVLQKYGFEDLSDSEWNNLGVIVLHPGGD